MTDWFHRILKVRPSEFRLVSDDDVHVEYTRSVRYLSVGLDNKQHVYVWVTSVHVHLSVVRLKIRVYVYRHRVSEFCLSIVWCWWPQHWRVMCVWTMSSMSHRGFILYILSPFIVTVFNVYMAPKRYHFVVFVVESPQFVYITRGIYVLLSYPYLRWENLFIE